MVNKPTRSRRPAGTSARADDVPRQSEDRFHILAEAADDFIYIIDREGRVDYLNSAAARLFGCRPQELVGRRVADLFAPETFARQWRNLQQVFESGRPLRVEALTVAGERRIWQDTSLTPLLDRQGRVQAVLGISRDITAQKQIEQVLRTSEEQYRTTIDAMGDPIHVVGPDLRIVLFNAAMRRWVDELHLGPAVIGQNVFELFPFLPQRVAQEYQQVFESGEVLVTEESTFVGEREFITETRKIPVFEGGKVARVVTIIHDITARKQAMEKLRESEERYRTLVETSPDGIILADMVGQVVMANPEAVRLHGCQNAAEMVGLQALDLVASAERELAVAEAQRALADGQVRRFECRILRRDGSACPAEVSISPVRDAAGRPTGFLWVLRDLTERRRLEEQFRQAQKMETVGRLAGGIAHDFNNLLTAIRGYAGLARERLRPGDPVRDDVEQVVKAAERAAALTGQLLAFSRRQVIEPRLIDLNELVADLERMLRRLIGEPIELVVRPAAEPCLVRVDPGQIEQALVNLVVNARDAMPDGGVLTIETAHETLDEEYVRQNAPGLAAGAYIRLTVRDTGVGMSDEVKGHLFEPFFTTKEAGQGTGLGLATVYGIIKQHQGHVGVQSELGRGTTFTIWLPRVAGDKSRLAREETPAAPPRGSETVLVVEDDPVVRTLMVRVLRTQGYRVLEASSGNEALRLAQRYGGQVHLLLTDAVMPHMDGKTLATLLRERCPALRVLYVSGYAADAITVGGTLPQDVELLPKPFGAEALARKVREVLDAAKYRPKGNPPPPGSRQTPGR